MTAADVDVTCLGETMVAFRPTSPGPLAEVPGFARGIGGAESNVACALARCGHRTRWIGRVGTDGFGTHVVETIASHGVDTSAVQRDPHRPTGIYFRTAGERATTAEPAGTHAEVVYYRAGSAASAMSPELIDRDTVWSTRILHLTGITPALSPGCLALTRALTAPAGRRPPLVSFDVNYRVSLWHNAPEGPTVLAELARRSDIVFVGEDEAEAAWGLRGAAAIRAALPEPGTLVVKRGAAGATMFLRDAVSRDRDLRDAVTRDAVTRDAVTRGMVTRASRDNATTDTPDDDITSQPAPAVEVVAPVGAGDAFAAGFLSATLRGLPPAGRLRHGHLMAAAALTAPGDLADPPDRAHADRLAALDDTAWGRLRLGPGWTTPAEHPADTRMVPR